MKIEAGTHFNDYFDRVRKAIDSLREEDLVAVTQAFLDCYERGGTVYIFGNGGSGSTASHITGDYIKGVSYGLEKRFKVICFNDNMSGLSATSNDIGYEDIFIEPMKNFLQAGDLAIGISGSGNSENVVRAINYAKEKGATTVAFVGYSGGKIKNMADHSIHAVIDDMEVAEDLHLIAFHVIKQKVIHALHGNEGVKGAVYDARMK